MQEKMPETFTEKLSAEKIACKNGTNKNEIQICLASENICNHCCAAKYTAQVHLTLRHSFS